jgi:hypothetical protein
MSSFRRAELRGSDELFRPTQPDAPPAKTVPELPAKPVQIPNQLGRPEGRLVRLTADEIALLADALQKLKFPTSQRPAVTKPSVDDFERLEDLRQKLLDAR